MAIFEFSASYRDARGQTGRTKFYIDADTPDHASTYGGIMRGLIDAVTNGQYSGGGGIINTPPFSGANGAAAQFQDAEDKMVLAFQDAQGSIHRIQIPAPKAAGFAADLETVLNAGAVAALITQITGVGAAGQFVTGLADSPWSSFLGGYRVRRKTIRRFNVRTLNPALTGPGL